MADDGDALQKVGYSHDKVIDVILANPRVKQKDIAAIFGYNEGWLSRMMSSDSFKLRVAQRRVELIDPIVTAGIQERFQALAHRGLEIIQDKLDQHADVVDSNLALKAVELGARGLGIGGFGSKVQVDIHNQIDLRSVLDEAAVRRRELLIPTQVFYNRLLDEPVTVEQAA